MTDLEQELTKNAIAIVEANIKRGKEISFIGEIKLDLVKKELVPNLSNPHLMDVANVSYYSGLFEIWTGKKRLRKTQERYYVGQKVERIEIGTYFDRR
jgi:hypothetical protein